MEEFFNNIWKVIIESNVLHLVWAVLILLLGWLLALFVSNRLGGLLRSYGVGHKLSGCLPEGANSSAVRVEKVITRIVFLVILLFTILACLSVLNLSEAAEPIRNFVNAITGYAANVIGAGLLVFIAWIVASVLKYVAITAAGTLKLEEKFSVGEEKGVAVSSTIGSTVYWLVFLFFLPAVLRALKITGITEPIEQMFAKIFDFLPNLLLGAGVMVVGLWAAGIVRKAVSGILGAIRVDDLGEKAGCGKLFGERKFSGLIGLIAYVLVAIPVVISSLTALKIEPLTRSLSGFFDMILNATANLLGAGILVFAAFVVGSITAGIVTQLLEGIGFDKLISTLCAAAPGEKVKPSAVVGKLTLIAIMFMASIAACKMLNFTELADLISRFMVFGGNILVAIVVLLIGIFLSNVAANAVAGSGSKSTVLVFLVRAAVLIFTGAIALQNIDIGGEIVTTAFTLLLGAVCVAAALAFGLGGREFAARKLEEWNEKLNRK